MNYRNPAAILVASVALAIAGCGGGGGESFTDNVGFLDLAISDGPIHSAQKVCVSFQEVEVKKAGESPELITFLEEQKINLLAFQGDASTPILTNERLPAGNYQWLRLGVDAVRGSNGGLGDTGGEDCDGEASYIIMDDGSMHNLYVPSGENNGLKLHGGYTIPANDRVSLTADFDLGKSIKTPIGQDPDVMLRPTIRLVNNNEVGTLTGQVANALAEAVACEPSVYVFDDGVTPNTIDDADDDPIATAIVNPEDQPDGSVVWSYTVGFLLTGDYEAAFTCDGSEFVPPAGKPAQINTGQTRTVDFVEADVPAG